VTVEAEAATDKAELDLDSASTKMHPDQDLVFTGHG